jgi:transposase-like protein
VLETVPDALHQDGFSAIGGSRIPDPILGLRAGDAGEGAKYRLQVLTELKNRGVRDVCMVVCDGVKDLPDSIGAV